MITREDIKVEEVYSHRNGITGARFFVVTFTFENTPMVGIVFDTPGHVAVFRRDLLGEGIIAFGLNSYRGDVFEPALRAHIVGLGA